MLCGFFSSKRPGYLIRVHSIMAIMKYQDILKHLKHMFNHKKGQQNQASFMAILISDLNPTVNLWDEGKR